MQDEKGRLLSEYRLAHGWHDTSDVTPRVVVNALAELQRSAPTAPLRRVMMNAAECDELWQYTMVMGVMAQARQTGANEGLALRHFGLPIPYALNPIFGMRSTFDAAAAAAAEEESQRIKAADTSAADSTAALPTQNEQEVLLVQPDVASDQPAMIVLAPGIGEELMDAASATLLRQQSMAAGAMRLMFLASTADSEPVARSSTASASPRNGDLSVSSSHAQPPAGIGLARLNSTKVPLAKLLGMGGAGSRSHSGLSTPKGSALVASAAGGLQHASSRLNTARLEAPISGASTPTSQRTSERNLRFK